MRYRRKFGWMILAGLVFVILFVFVTMFLWNWLVPDLFNGPMINFWQTAGLLLLAKIIFGFSSKGGGGSWKKYKGHDRHKNLTPEEKEAIKRRFMEKCGWKDESTESTSAEVIEPEQDSSEEKS